jgi:hypothetical protein
LGNIGPAARAAIPVLIQALPGADPNGDMRIREALEKIDPAAADSVRGR